MNKSLIILVLTLLQCACVSHEPVSQGSHSLLSFDAIGAEISVSYEALDPADDLSKTVALNAK